MIAVLANLFFAAVLVISVGVIAHSLVGMFERLAR